MQLVKHVVYVILSPIHHLAQEILGTAIIYSHVYLHHSGNEIDSYTGCTCLLPDQHVAVSINKTQSNGFKVVQAFRCPVMPTALLLISLCFLLLLSQGDLLHVAEELRLLPSLKNKQTNKQTEQGLKGNSTDRFACGRHT